MQENRQFQEDNAEINIIDLFWSVLSHWRVLLAALLIGGVLLGAFIGLRDYRSLSDEKGKEARQRAYEEALEAYKLQKSQLEGTVAILREAQERQQYYQDNALMLQMDQYNVWFITAAYCIDMGPEAGEDRMTDLYYAQTTLKRYQSVVNQIEQNQIIATPEQPDLTATNPAGTGRSLLETSTDSTVSVLTIMIRADSEERANKLYDAVKETLAEQEKALAGTGGPYRLTLISENSYSGVDTEIGKVQMTFQNNVKTTADTIATAKSSLAALKAPSNSVPTLKSVVKRAIKYGAVGAAAGLFAAAFIDMVLIVIQDRLNSTEEAERRYRLPVLGTVTEKGKKKTKLDAFLAKRLGFDFYGSAQEAADYAASNVRFQLKDGARLLLVGGCGKEKLDALKEQLASRLKDVEITVGGNVNTDAAAVEALRTETAVVCVEEWMKTPHKAIRREMQTVADSGNRNLGIIAIR